MTTYSHFQGGLFEDESISSPEDFPASHSVPPESERAEPMNDISFRKCFELFQRSNRVGSSLKTFGACLVSNLDQYSPRLSHHWKAKATRSLRFVFLLQPSKPRTDETDCGLLPIILNTPNVMDSLPIRSPEAMKRQMENNRPGRTQPPTLREQVAMLPSPQSRDHFPSHTQEYVAEKKALGHGMANLNDTISFLLPTPVANDDNKSPGAHLAMKARMKGGPRNAITSLAVMVQTIPSPHGESANGAGRHGTGGPNIQTVVGEKTGMKLQPGFVEWMMGYPIGYTDLKPSETASSRKSPSRSSKQSRKPKN